MGEGEDDFFVGCVDDRLSKRSPSRFIFFRSPSDIFYFTVIFGYFLFFGHLRTFFILRSPLGIFYFAVTFGLVPEVSIHRHLIVASTRWVAGHLPPEGTLF